MEMILDTQSRNEESRHCLFSICMSHFGFKSYMEKILLRNIGVPGFAHPGGLSGARRLCALGAKVVESMKPEQLIDEVKASGCAAAAARDFPPA